MRALGLLLAAALLCGSVHAAVPHQINYQGYLTASGGTSVNAPTTGLIGTISTAQIAHASVTTAKLASNSCSSGQVLQYNGSAWACATPAATSGGTVTSITALERVLDWRVWIGSVSQHKLDRTESEPIETSGKFPVEECSVEALALLISGGCDFCGDTNLTNPRRLALLEPASDHRLAGAPCVTFSGVEERDGHRHGKAR